MAERDVGRAVGGAGSGRCVLGRRHRGSRVVVELGAGPVDPQRRQRQDAVAAVLGEAGRCRGEAAPDSLERDGDLARAFDGRAQVVERQRPGAPGSDRRPPPPRPGGRWPRGSRRSGPARSTTPDRSRRRTGPDPTAATAVSVTKRDTPGNLAMSSVVPVQAVLIVGGVAAVLLVAVVISHNRFVSQRQLIDNAWANVDTELRRRYDLIPNLVRTVEGYATHEREVLRSVVEARSEAVRSDGDVSDQEPVPSRRSCDSLRSLLAVAEAYPDLKADEHFLELQQRARRHRGPHPGRSAPLQRQRPRLQPAGGVGAVEHRRPRWRVPPSRLLRAGGSGAGRRPAPGGDVLMHPAERVRIVTETARAVLEARLDPATGAQTLALQQAQIGARLRSDRIDVTQAEADAVALTLRRLAEQVSDLASARPDPDSNVEMARILGELAQTLR